MSFLQPKTASSKERVILRRTSSPLIGPLFLLPEDVPPPKKLEKISEISKPSNPNPPPNPPPPNPPDAGSNAAWPY